MKKRKNLIMTTLAGLLLAMLLSTGCQSILVTRTGEKPSEETETRQFDFTEFSRLEIGSAFSYEIKQSDTYSISITANDNLFDDIEVAKEGQTLKIGMEFPEVPWAIFNIDPRPKAVITMPLLNGLVGSGATHGVVSNFSSSEDLEIVMSGASSMEMVKIAAGDVTFIVSGASKVSGDLEAGNTDFEVSGASSVQLEGSAKDVVIYASGASRLKMADFHINNADITLSGASKGTINAAGELDVQLSGASTLEYIGQPTLVDMDISGGSTLKKK